MYVTRVPNRSSPPAVLLRENWREGGKVKSRTLANLTHWPDAKVEALRRVLRGETFLAPVTSSYLEGRCCELARFGYSRDGRPDRPQIVFGLLCSADGCPVAVEVFEGDAADPKTLAAQIDKLKKRFRLKRVVLVGDRGMITQARIEADLKPAGLDWITALRAPAIRALAADGGPLQLSLFDEKDMAEIESPDYPGERLIVCRNPLLAAERARKREDLLAATEADLARIRAATTRARNPLRGRDKIALRVGAVLGRRKVAKHFKLTVTEETLGFVRDAEAVARRGGARRVLRAAHLRAGRNARCRCHRAGV